MSDFSNDPVVATMVPELRSKIEEANALAELISNSNTEYDVVLKKVENEYETEEINDLQSQIEELEKILNKIFATRATEIVNEASATSGNITESKERLTLLKKGIGGLTTFLVGQYGEEVIKDLPTLKGTRSSSGTGKGSGVMRIRGYNWIYDGTSYENLSGAVKVADLDIKEVQAQVIAINGEDRTTWPTYFAVEVSGKKIEANSKE